MKSLSMDGNSERRNGRESAECCQDCHESDQLGPGNHDSASREPADPDVPGCTLSVYRAVAAVAAVGAPEDAIGASEEAAGTPEGAASAAASGPAATPAPPALPAPSAAATPAYGCPDGGYPDGFAGELSLRNPESLDQFSAGETLGRVAHLIAWAQAQQARLLNRMEEIFRRDYAAATGQTDPGMAFSLAAAECAAILHVPQVTAQRMLLEADALCGTHTATLDGLEEGHLTYPHAQVLLDQCQSVPPVELPEFEANLLQAARGQTRAQFSCKARRLREKRYPETVPERHRTAFEQRHVTLDREEDGMSCLSAHLRAAEAQQIFTALSNAARGERTAGDTRTTDQLRADILAQLLMGGLGSARGPGSAGTAGGDDEAGHETGVLPRAEIMVLISAETLFGANEEPAELHGYGPIGAEEARRLARNALHWTGLVRDPQTGEILGVGRRRKVPAGLSRWLRARDGTCRFPGCRVSTAISEIDHTLEWGEGGDTHHGNLAHLCRRHHRFKTLGFWKASQPAPGIMEWTSPGGRVYRTEPFLALASPCLEPEDCRDEDPPPF